MTESLDTHIPLTTGAYSTSPSHHPDGTCKEAKIQYIADRFAEILQALGLDLTHPSVADTPHRVASMYVHELFWGMDPNTYPAMTDFEEPQASGQIICVDNIAVSSMCEHHLMPIVGTADVAYVAKDRVLGLSKIHRLVDYLARRPQLQERLTGQIADSLALVLDTEDIAVQVKAWHGCVACRGVQHRNSHTTTRLIKGTFELHPPF